MGSKQPELEIRVCKTCAWTEKRVKQKLQELLEAHPDRIRLVKESCLDHCSDEPVVIVGTKCLAPARPKKIEKAVTKHLA